MKYAGRAPDGHVLLRAFVGGALDEAALDADDARLIALGRAQLAELLGARGEPVLASVSRHRRAMPQYHVGHLERVEAIELGRAASRPRPGRRRLPRRRHPRLRPLRRIRRRPAPSHPLTLPRNARV